MTTHQYLWPGTIYTYPDTFVIKVMLHNLCTGQLCPHPHLGKILIQSTAGQMADSAVGWWAILNIGPAHFQRGQAITHPRHSSASYIIHCYFQWLSRSYNWISKDITRGYSDTCYRVSSPFTLLFYICYIQPDPSNPHLLFPLLTFLPVLKGIISVVVSYKCHGGGGMLPTQTHMINQHLPYEPVPMNGWMSLHFNY